MRIKLLKHTIVCMAVLMLLLGAGCSSADKSSSSKRSKTKNAKTGTGSSKGPSRELSEEQEGFFPLVLNEAFEMYPPGGKPPAGPAWTVEGDTIKCSGEPAATSTPLSRIATLRSALTSAILQRNRPTRRKK